MKKVMSKTVVSLITFCFLTFYSYSYLFGQLADLVATNEKSIFQVLAYDEYGIPSGQGTGFFIDNKGTCLTNFHVLEGVKFAFIKNHEGKIFQILKVTRISEDCDIAEFIVDLKSEPSIPLKLNYEMPLKASDIFVIGNPEGFENTVSTGIISSIRTEENNKILQITAPISPGSSGSPIMNMKGEVLGIATYVYEGQNLNFGYASECLKKLGTNQKINLSTKETGNLFVVNKVYYKDNNLILNSIELNDKNTVVNLSYINTEIFQDSTEIFTSIAKKEKAFFIEDIGTGQKYYIYDASIEDENSPTKIALGHIENIKLYFPKINNLKLFNLKEGDDETIGWWFLKINLDDCKDMVIEDDNFLHDIEFYQGLELLKEKDAKSSYDFFLEYAKKHSKNDYTNHLAGILGYIMGNNLEAITYIKKAIEINPTYDDYYFKLSIVHNSLENYDEALKSINSAIRLNETQHEYYGLRASIYYEKEDWQNALNDYNSYIDSEFASPDYEDYYNRAHCKIMLDDKTACDDLKKSYGLTEDIELKAQIKKVMRKECR